MDDVQELEERVQQLEPDQLTEFRTWFVALANRQWGEEIAADLASGKLDGLIGEATADRNAGRTRELCSIPPDRSF